MKDFIQLLRQQVDAYGGDHAELIAQAPLFVRLMANLLGDPNLPGRLRPLVLTAIGYFALPDDIMPEDLQGPFGYLDDLYLSALVADRVRRELGGDSILVDNWEGERPVQEWIDEILASETSLVGDRRDLILWYIGYQFLQNE